MNITEVQLGKPLNFTRVMYRVWGEELFIEVEMTDSKTAGSFMDDNSQSSEHTAYCTACRQLDR